MKAIIKQMVNETINKLKITKISVMDFDGTLVDTALPETGKIEYEKKTGKVWPHVGWWSKPESLDMNVFDMPVINSVVAAYKVEKANPETLCVMMTGRQPKLQNLVKAILDSKGLVFDKYIYSHGGNTIDSKIKSLNSLLLDYPKTTAVELWDDRTEHISSFEAWGNSHPELKFRINLVPGNHH